MDQVQSKLEALTIQLQELAKGKERHEEVWCITCRIKGHHKNYFPNFKDYFSIGVLNHLGVWCEICKMMGHHPTTCSLMQKYNSTARNLFCIFFKFVEHDEKEFHALYLMREHTMDAYRVQGEEGQEGGVL